MYAGKTQIIRQRGKFFISKQQKNDFYETKRKSSFNACQQKNWINLHAAIDDDDDKVFGLWNFSVKNWAKTVSDTVWVWLYSSAALL